MAQRSLQKADNKKKPKKRVRVRFSEQQKFRAKWISGYVQNRRHNQDGNSQDRT